ncbi:MAG: acyltransferase [Actinobacteria bacterium]|nr:MAG: acyltransferase [Actinomycetota bacterium]
MLTCVNNQRTDIQGLRGIAVLAVVLYHANQFIHGGFVGVDIFFVISGYVIFNSIIREHGITGSISLRDFIVRRIHRLLPALSFLIIGTLIASVFVLSPFGDQQQVAHTSQAASLFTANVYLALQNSYFALVNNPLRHTWTLAVEEQFYLFLIVLLYVLHLITRKISAQFTKFVLRSVIVLGVISFLLSVMFSFGNRLIPLPTRVAFFSMPTRAWEFSVGILIALTETRRLRNKFGLAFSNSLSLIGMSLIVIALFRFNTFTTFPGFAAVIPVVGSGLLILDSHEGNLVKRALKFRPLVWIGDVSYSWYLWHWPMIVFSVVLWPGNHVAVLAAAFGSLVPALASYYLIENRFRITSDSPTLRKSTARIFLVSVFAPLLVSVVVILGASTGYGLHRNISPGLTESLAYKSGCQMDILPFPQKNCVFVRTPGRPLILLIGDSQAGTASDPLYEAAKSLDFNFAVWFNNGCPIFPRPTVERGDCQSYLDALPELIAKLDPALILIANTSTLYTTAGAQRGGLTITKENGKPPATYQEAIDTWIDGLSTTLSSPELLSRRVVVVGQVPPSRFLSPSILRPKVSTQSFDLSSVSDRNLIIQGEKGVVNRYSNSLLFDTADYLCPEGSCRYSVDGEDAYNDSLHLTVKGAMLLTEGFRAMLRQQVK